MAISPLILVPAIAKQPITIYCCVSPTVKGRLANAYFVKLFLKISLNNVLWGIHR